MANRMVWLKIVLGEYFTLIKRLGFEISIKNRVRTAKKVIKQPLGYLKNISSSHIFKADRIANLERPRIPNYLYWFRRYEFQKLNEKIRKLYENQFFLFFFRKIILRHSCSQHFLKGLLKSILCRNFRYVAQMVQKIWPNQCSEKCENCPKNQFFIFSKQKNNFRRFLQSTFFEGPIEVYFV